MSLSKRLSKQEVIEGEIGYFGLGEWWLSTFSPDEREYIERSVKPFRVGTGGSDSNSRPLTQGKIASTGTTACNVLSGIPVWLKRPEDLSIARRCFEKAEEVGRDNVLDLHFLYLQMIRIFYGFRDFDPSLLDEAVEACEKQIAIASRAAKAFLSSGLFAKLPEHTGYKQLSIIYEKQGRFSEALQLSERAQREGWNGDWEKRIARLRTKL